MNLLKAARAYLRASILRQFVLAVVAVNAALVLLLGVEVVQRGSRQNVELRATRATGMASLLGLGAVAPIRSGDRAELQRLADAAMAVNSVNYVVFLDRSGRFLAGDSEVRNLGIPQQLLRDGPVPADAAGRLINMDDSGLEAGAPVVANGDTIGWVRISVGRNVAAADQQQLLLTTFVFSLATILLTALVAFLTARSMTTRLSSLADTAQRFRLGDHRIRARDVRPDEVGQVGRGLNLMLDTIQASERSLQNVFRIAKVGAWRYVPSLGIIQISETLHELLGLTRGETGILAADMIKLLPAAKVREFGELLEDRDDTRSVTFTIDLRQLHGTERVCWGEARFETCLVSGEPILTGICQDVTERELATTRLRQAQKMEAVGQLTGGLAHDFNNLLAIIIGNLDLLDDGQMDDPLDRECLGEALQAAQRGSELTQRLLAFSRRQTLAPQRLNLNSLIEGMAPLWRRTIGEAIEVRTRLADDLWPTHADPTQVESALLNLVINARDSMPNGGFLGISTQNVSLEAETEEHDADIIRGDYCVVAVSDSGCGMPPDVAARAFDPFFTTKGVGEGSGLGLSMVYGFVKQSGGTVKIQTEAGHGTTIRLYLPRAGRANGAKPQAGGATADIPVASNETVLVVEDNESVLKVAERQLRELGYSVLSARSGADALAMLDREPGVDLLFTDIVMPGGMNGVELAQEARRRKPELKILHTSGFAGPLGEEGEEGGASLRLLAKPYRKADLALRIRELLDAA